MLVGSVGVLALPRPELEPQYFFATTEHEIRMTLEYYDNEPNRHLGFEDRASDRHFCLSAKGEENRNCISGFKGSMAVARYRISSRGLGKESPLLREYVRSIDQSDRVPARPPFERVIEVQHGLASDIQVFGYQDNSLGSTPQADAFDDAWCLLRQNLYLNGKTVPFLIVHWKHALDGIRVLDVIPQNGTWRVGQDRTRRR